MPHRMVNGHRVHYRIDGPADAPALVLSNSLGADLDLWREQVATLSRDHRILRYDTRGHGGSSTTSGEYSMALLGNDVLGLTAALGIEEFSFCGISMGGQIGLWLALNAASRLRRLILCNTGSKIGETDGWNDRIASVRAGGMASLAQATLERWFTPSVTAANPTRVAEIGERFRCCDPEGYVACCAAIRDADFRAEVARIETPVIFIAGRHDPVTPSATLQALAGLIRGSRIHVLEAAHLSNIEDAASFNGIVAPLIR